MRLRLFAAASAMLVFSLAAHADDLFTFTLPLTSGPTTGTVTGTLDLGFVSPGGSGTGAASSLVITSYPSGFGSFTSGNLVTNFAGQYANSFTVLNGVITSDLFFAAQNGTVNGDLLCLNSTSTDATAGSLDCQAKLNELNNANTFGYNFAGGSGIVFTQAASSVTPEPSSLALLGTGVLGVIGAARRRFLR